MKKITLLFLVFAFMLTSSVLAETDDQTMLTGNESIDQLISHLHSDWTITRLDPEQADQESLLETYFRFEISNGCKLLITTEKESDKILSLEVDDTYQYNLRTALSDAREYLESEATDELKALYHAIIASDILKLHDGLAEQFLAFPLKGEPIVAPDGTCYVAVSDQILGDWEIQYEKTIDQEEDYPLRSALTLSRIDDVPPGSDFPASSSPASAPASLLTDGNDETVQEIDIEQMVLQLDPEIVFTPLESPETQADTDQEPLVEEFHRFQTDQGCLLVIGQSINTRKILSVEIEDTHLYNLRTALSDAREYLESEATDELKHLFSLIASSEWMELDDETKEQLLAMPLKGDPVLTPDGACYEARNSSVFGDWDVTYEKTIDQEEDYPLRSALIMSRPDQQSGPVIEPRSFPFQAFTNVEKVVVRKTASQLSRKISRIDKEGTKVTVTAEETDEYGMSWYAITTLDNKNGYIRADLLRTSSFSGASAPSSSVGSPMSSGPVPGASMPMSSSAGPGSVSPGMSPMGGPSFFGMRSVGYNPQNFATENDSFSFTRITLTRRQKLAVYSAPSSRSWRGANRKAFASTNGAIWYAGYDGNWMMILYDTSGGNVRVGYVDATKIKGTIPGRVELVWSGKTTQTLQEVTVTDDLANASSAIIVLKPDTEVTFLGTYADCAYIECQVSGRTARGFVPKESLAISQELEDGTEADQKKTMSAADDNAGMPEPVTDLEDSTDQPEMISAADDTPPSTSEPSTPSPQVSPENDSAQ